MQITYLIEHQIWLVDMKRHQIYSTRRYESTMVGRMDGMWAIVVGHAFKGYVNIKYRKSALQEFLLWN